MCVRDYHDCAHVRDYRDCAHARRLNESGRVLHLQFHESGHDEPD